MHTFCVPLLLEVTNFGVDSSIGSYGHLVQDKSVVCEVPL